MGELRCIRIAQVIKERLAKIFVRELADRIGFVTITDLRVSPDLRNATVFYSVLGTDSDRRATAAALVKATPYINADIGRNLHIKFTPRLTFKYDSTPENASRVYEILHHIEEEQIENTENTQEGTVEDKKSPERPEK